MKRLYTLIFTAVIAIAAIAQSAMSPAMRAHVKQARASDVIEAFVTADDAAFAAMAKSGIAIDARLGNKAIISGNREALNKASKLSGISNIERPGKVHLHTDSARSYTHVNPLLQGQGFDMPYDGTGVVLGMIDCGIEYHHMAFNDANGNSRITRIYHPADKTGEGVMVDGKKQEGREYVTAEEIASVLTDDKTMGHGTHTAGIAAGTTVEKYGGMAPGAELVMVGIPNDDLSIENVVRGVYYVACYAASVGKPCVINMSMGSHDGPHDGTGYLQSYMKDLNQRFGTIFVLSSGNEGSTSLYLHKKFTATNTKLSTIMAVSGLNTSEIYAYSRNDSPLAVSFGVYDSYNNKVKATSGVFTTDTVVDISSIPGFSDALNGTVTISQGVSDGKYHLIMVNEVASYVYGNFLTFTIHGQDGGEVDVWDSNTDASFSDFGVPGYTAGNAEGSYSDMATGDYCISVGASVARDRYPANNQTYTNGYKVGGMGRFSSYGTDVNGVIQPFITAPGVSVVSSVSSFNCNKNTYSQRYSYNSKYYYWYTKSGTSMSAPVVSGIVALWLQACPNATLSQIKEAMAQTAVLAGDGNPMRGANGDIDAEAGLHYLLEHSPATRGDVNGDGKVDVADINCIINIILETENAATYGGRADVNGDGKIDIADINAVIDIILEK